MDDSTFGNYKSLIPVIEFLNKNDKNLQSKQRKIKKYLNYVNKYTRLISNAILDRKEKIYLLNVIIDQIINDLDRIFITPTEYELKIKTHCINFIKTKLKETLKSISD